jgi:hypothetical protein
VGAVVVAGALVACVGIVVVAVAAVVVVVAVVAIVAVVAVIVVAGSCWDCVIICATGAEQERVKKIRRGMISMLSR